jgi:hypothetical protein
MYLGQPGVGIWVQASCFPVEFGQEALVASCFPAIVAIAAVFLHSANERLRRGNQARYRIADSVGAVGIGSHILFEGIAIARARKAFQKLSKLNYVVM